MNENDFWAGLEVICTYTRAQAIADGVLIDLCKIAPDVCKQLFPGVSICCTDTLFGDIERLNGNKKFSNDFNGIIWDILYMSRDKIVNSVKLNKTEIEFQVIITGISNRKMQTYKVVMGTTDDLKSPALTSMFPEED
ncbi:MAG: DUF6573 family protein [Desulfuromonadaceae bacterium]